MKRDVYSRRLKLNGEEDSETVLTANNYAASLNAAQRFEEAKSLLLKTMPVTRRILGEGNRLTLALRKHYAEALFAPENASRDDQREAVAVLADNAKARRRIFGTNHPATIRALRMQERAKMRLEDVDTPPS